MIGRPIISIPEPNLTTINENRLSQWQKTTKVVKIFWKKWKNDYLNTLQARSKWMDDKNDLFKRAIIKIVVLPIKT